MDCIFCKIIKGEIPSEKIYEDDKVLAFLDIKPVHKGHVLVIPKEHYENLIETPDEIVSEIWKAAKKIGQAVKIAMEADGVNFGVNNGKAAGQEVFHMHIHIIPRFEGDELSNWSRGVGYGEGEMEELGEKIKEKLLT